MEEVVQPALHFHLIGNQPVQVAESLAEMLLNTLPLDFVYLRLRVDASGLEPEVVRTGRLPTATDRAREIGQALAPWLNDDDAPLLHTIPNPLGTGVVRLLRAPLGPGGDEGVVVAASRQAVFPSEDVRLLLSVGANHAGTVIGRSRAEQELRESEQCFRQLAESIDGYFWLNSPDGSRVLYISPGYEKICGRTCESLYRRPESRTEIIHSDDRDRVLAIVREPLGASGRQIEYRILRPDGAVRWIRDRAFPVRDSSGNVCRVAGIGEDITDRKLAEQDLKSKNEILQTIFDHIPVMINFINSAGDVHLVNRHWEKVLGWSGEEAQALNILAEVYPDPEYREKVAEFVRRPSPGWTDFKTKVRDGRTIDTSWSIIALSDGTRIGFGQDISQRREAEAETLTLNAALENALEGIARLDIDGNCLAVNPAYADMLGYQSEELVGSYWPRTMHPDDMQLVQAAYQRMLRDNRVELEVRALRKDESVFWQHLTMVTTCNQLGQRIGHYCFMKDITERKQSENALRQLAVRLQDLSRRAIDVQEQDRRHLARELHDEIGQILSTISVNLQANMKLCSCESRERLEECTSIVNAAIQQVHNLSLDLRPSMLDDLGLVSTLRWCANRQSQTAGFELSFAAESTGAGLPAELEIACYRVAQEALTNIVRHAQARHVWVGLRQPEEGLELEIRDDGVGFDLDAVRRTASRGANFGVIGMEERVEILGGQIEFTSRAGHGTRIRVRFPLPSKPTHRPN